MEKKFFQYDYLGKYPTIQEIPHPQYPMYGRDPDVFLIYAENKEEAFKLACAHIYDEKPLEKFYGTYENETYHGEIECVI